MRFKDQFLTVAASAAVVTLVVQVLAFLRQLLIAGYFGVGRSFDSYVMVYVLATLTVFTFGTVCDSVAIPHLVRARERDGLEASLTLARSIFRLSLWLSAGASLVFLAAVPLLAPLFATGFSPDERAGLAGLAWYFLPWTFLYIPYYAAAVRHKMEWHYHRVFLAEFVMILVSIGCLTLLHNDIRTVPLAFACGYGVGLAQLTFGAALLQGIGGLRWPLISSVSRNMAQLFLSLQTSGFASLIDRHIQSFLPIGSIGAINYSTQITASLSTLLSLREIYMVPLTRQADRIERLERLLSGLLLLAVPAACLVSYFAPDLIQILLQRGRFDAEATALTASVLRIAAFSIIVSAISNPLFRMFQIIDRINYTYIVTLSIAISLAAFGYLFVFACGYGIRGIALMQLASGVVSTVVTVLLIGRCGIRLRWRPIFGWFMLAAGASAVACIAAAATSSRLQSALSRVTLGGTAYGLVIIVFYVLARSQMRGIMLGVSSSKTQAL